MIEMVPAGRSPSGTSMTASGASRRSSPSRSPSTPRGGWHGLTPVLGAIGWPHLRWADRANRCRASPDDGRHAPRGWTGEATLAQHAKTHDPNSGYRDRNTSGRGRGSSTRDQSDIGRDRNSSGRERISSSRDRPPSGRDRSPDGGDRTPHGRDRRPRGSDRNASGRDWNSSRRNGASPTRNPFGRRNGLIFDGQRPEKPGNGSRSRHHEHQ